MKTFKAGCRALCFIFTAALAASYIKDRPWYILGILSFLISLAAFYGWLEEKS
jgi:hypothetical protein